VIFQSNIFKNKKEKERNKNMSFEKENFFDLKAREESEREVIFSSFFKLGIYEIKTFFE